MQVKAVTRRRKNTVINLIMINLNTALEVSPVSRVLLFHMKLIQSACIFANVSVSVGIRNLLGK